MLNRYVYSRGEEIASTRTLIDIDDDALSRAASVLGTTTNEETVNRALRLAAGTAESEVDAACFRRVPGTDRGESSGNRRAFRCLALTGLTADLFV